MSDHLDESRTNPTILLEQYKAYVGDLAGIGSRYATAQSFYISIVSLLIAALAIKEPLQPLQEYFGWISFLVFLFIAAICLLWKCTLQFYEGLFAVKFKVLKKMEAMGGFFEIYKEEYELLRNEPVSSLISTERKLPQYLFWVALLFAFGTLSYDLMAFFHLR